MQVSDFGSAYFLVVAQYENVNFSLFRRTFSPSIVHAFFFFFFLLLFWLRSRAYLQINHNVCMLRNGHLGSLSWRGVSKMLENN